MKIFGREPAAFIVVIESVLALLVTFNLSGLSNEQAGLIVALVVAVGGAVQAWATRDTLLAALVAVSKAVLVLGAAYGWSVSSEQMGLITVVVAAVAGLWLRTQTAPVETVVSAA